MIPLLVVSHRARGIMGVASSWGRGEASLVNGASVSRENELCRRSVAMLPVHLTPVNNSLKLLRW
jgi:hypothetical protein